MVNFPCDRRHWGYKMHSGIRDGPPEGDRTIIDPPFLHLVNTHNFCVMPNAFPASTSPLFVSSISHSFLDATTAHELFGQT
jgi:hypothetical protein